MISFLITTLRALNDLLTAGIAITAFSLLLYALSFNLRDRVARLFAFILSCVVIVFVGEAIASVTASPHMLEFWLSLQWVGIILLPPAYVHFSDALLATTGRPSRGRRRRVIRITYAIALLFLIALPSDLLVGPLVQDVSPAPHLQRTWLTWVFALFYLVIMIWAWVNFVRAYQRTVTSASRRRMRYLLIGALAPALGSYPYLLFGSGLATDHPLVFWTAATSSNLLVSVLLVVMAYAVAFFGVAWPDRVVKRRLFKWLMRGPVTASSVLAITTVVRRLGQAFDVSTSAVVPILMVASFLIFEHVITLVAPIWERLLFHGNDGSDLNLLQTLEERILTTGDLRDFLESVLAAICDRLQVSRAFIVSLSPAGLEMLVTIGNENPFKEEDRSEDLINAVRHNGGSGVQRADSDSLFTWKNYWLVPLYATSDDDGKDEEQLMGFLGAARELENTPDDEQVEALMLLSRRAAIALEDYLLQQQVFTSLEALTPQVDLIQRLRAAARYDGTDVLTSPDVALEDHKLSRWVKDALSHYWGGPKLSQNPLIGLQVVQRVVKDHKGNPSHALRAILREAIDRVRPEGERRFTTDWILYNILEMKFMEGRKVREVAMRLAMSEADLYRKQRVAIEAVARALVAMEQRAREEENQKQK
jgi:hypothetical protein